MNRLLNTSSITGSASVPMACVRLSASTRVSTRWFFARQLGLPAGLDHDGLVRLDDDGGASTLWPGLSCSRVKTRPRAIAVGEEPRAPRRRAAAWRACALHGLLAELGAAADRFDRHRLDHQLLGAVDEAEARLVRLLEGALHRGQGAGLDHQRRVGAGVADMRAHDHLDLGRRHALAGDFGLDVLAEASRRSRLIAASALSPNGTSIACSRVARMSASPMP